MTLHTVWQGGAPAFLIKPVRKNRVRRDPPRAPVLPAGAPKPTHALRDNSNLLRVLRVLNVLAEHKVLNVVELAEKTGVSRSTLRNTLAAIVASGWAHAARDNSAQTAPIVYTYRGPNTEAQRACSAGAQS